MTFPEQVDALTVVGEDTRARANRDDDVSSIFLASLKDPIPVNGYLVKWAAFFQWESYEVVLQVSQEMNATH